MPLAPARLRRGIDAEKRRAHQLHRSHRTLASGWRSASILSIPSAAAKRMIYAQVLRCLCHLMGTTCVSVYPYQLGHDNDEAIESERSGFIGSLDFGRDEPICKNWRNAKKAESPPIRSIGLRAYFATAGGGARPLRDAGQRIRGVGQFQYAQHWLGCESPDGARVWRRCWRMRDHSRQELEQTLGASTSSWKRARKQPSRISRLS